MLRFKLIRSSLGSGEEGTFGGIYNSEAIRLCVTCEDPWNDNAKGKSCIPAGIYRVKKFSGTRYKNVWEITGVPGRAAILIHNGNTTDDTQGCVLVGARFGTVNGKRAVLDSVLTLDKLRSILPDEFALEVINPAT